MAYVTEPLLQLPMPTTQANTTITNAVNLLLDAATEAAALIFVAPDGGGALDKTIFGTNTITGTCTVDIRIETVDITTGFPTGSLVAAGATGSQGSLASNTQYEVTIGTPPTLTEGTKYAVVIVYNAGTSINIAGTQFAPAYRSPEGALFTGGAWAFSANPPAVAVRIGGAYVQFYGFMPARHTGAITLSSSTPDELGNAFTIPVKRRATGIWIFQQTNSVAADFEVTLYQGTSVIETITVDASAIASNTGMAKFYPFTTPRDIEASTLYRVTYHPTTTTAGTGQFATFTALNADHMAAFPGAGAWYQTTRTDAGAFTDTTSAMHMIGLVFDAIDIPGALIVHGGMTGGLNG